MLTKRYLLGFGLAVLSCIALLSGGSRTFVPHAKAGAACPGAPKERYRVNIRIETPPPKINHNLNRAELGSMAFHGITDNILGLHVYGIEFEYKAKYGTEPQKGGYCFWVRTIDVLLRYDTPDIYVAKEYRRNSCNYRVVLEHEKRHEKIARQVMKRYIPRFQSVFTSLLIPDPKSAILVGSREDGKRKVKALLEEVIRPVYKEFEVALAREQAAVDALREYRKVWRRCKRW